MKAVWARSQSGLERPKIGLGGNRKGKLRQHLDRPLEIFVAAHLHLGVHVAVRNTDSRSGNSSPTGLDRVGIVAERSS